MQLPMLLQTFHRQYVAPIGLNSEERTGFDGFAIQEHRARPAVGGIAADVRASQAQDIAQEMDEEEPRLDLSLAGHAIDGDSNTMCGHDHLPPA
jgi:hypothetical protein